jgi:hypothetical protein
VKIRPISANCLGNKKLESCGGLRSNYLAFLRQEEGTRKRGLIWQSFLRGANLTNQLQLRQRCKKRNRST